MEFEQTLQQEASPQDVEAFIRATIEGERNRVATLANVSAIMNQYLARINWVGFYLRVDENTLVLGPFQGRVACTRIRAGQGVVGRCAQKGQTLIVPNVFEFPGHIACDSQSRSEIVVPIVSAKHVAAVLDVDAPEFDRFQVLEQSLLERIARMLGENWDFMTDD